MVLLSCDPGLHGLGCGLFEDGVLLAGWYAGLPPGGRGPARWAAVVEAGVRCLTGLHVDVLAVEVMQVYDRAGGGSKGDPADILEVQGVAGCLAGWALGHGVVEQHGYLPFAWKSQVPANILAHRIEARVGELGWADRLERCPARRRGDMLHGVGVGLHHLGLMHGGRSH